MPAVTKVSLEEYLSTTYRPDRDYVDGEVVERNVGDRIHAVCQLKVGAYLLGLEQKLKIRVATELRVPVSDTRFRIPDVCVIRGEWTPEKYPSRPPFLCVEILSEDDTLDSIQERVDDYSARGVEYVWVINPRTKRGWFYHDHALVEAIDGVLRTENPVIAMPLAEVVS